MKALVLVGAAFLSIACLSGCAHSKVMPHSLGVAELLVDEVQYDGIRLTARVLVSAKGGAVVLDGRMAEFAHLGVKAVRTCDTGEEITFWTTDSFPAPTEEKDLLILPDGFFYGKRATFSLFMGPVLVPECTEGAGCSAGPDCIVLEVGLPARRTGPTSGAETVKVRATKNPDR